jgi:DNA-binding response OmpR family regulator
MNTVVVIEEDEVARKAIGALLRRENFKAILASDAEQGLKNVCLRPRLVVASLPLAHMSGVGLCRRIATLGVRTPVVFLSARADPLEEILLLELGADDYVAKPFRECELMARIRAVLRRSAPRVERRICFGDVEIDVERRYIRRSGDTVKITPNEYNLLLFFIRNADQALTRDAILNEVWGYDCYPNTRTVDAHVVRLRSKLEPDPRAPRYLLTIHGVGYRFLMFPANSSLFSPFETTCGAGC